MGQAVAALRGKERSPGMQRHRPTLKSFYPIPELSERTCVRICLGRLFFSLLFVHTQEEA